MIYKIFIKYVYSLMFVLISRTLVSLNISLWVLFLLAMLSLFFFFLRNLRKEKSLSLFLVFAFLRSVKKV